MAIKKNAITLFVWLIVIIVLATRIVINRQNDMRLVSQRSITQVKTTILKRTESSAHVKYDGEKDDVAEISADDDVVNSKLVVLKRRAKVERAKNLTLNENKRLKGELKEKIKQLEKLKAQNRNLLEKEKQFKSLARRLAAKLKGKEGGQLPRLDGSKPWVFAITPTYARFTQKADLTRLAHTLQHVTNMHWLIVEDSTFRTNLVSKLLQQSGLSFTHLKVRTPDVMQKKKGEKYNKHHRGVEQRNLGLKWLRENVDPKKTPGVVYFMDDDNTYHKRIFDEMRYTKGVSAWPVGLSGGARWAGPVCKNNRVVGFHTNWAADRSFPIDMAAFAVNLKVLLKDYPTVGFDQTAKRGYLEPTFLQSITTREKLEAKASNCTEVLVWHTRTESPKQSLKGEKELIKLGKPSNPEIEV